MLNKYHRGTGAMQFNMTPIIDIVFLLIIFFMLVCQFIVAENFEVTVPDEISSGRSADTAAEQATTVTVMLNESDGVSYAVGSERITSVDDSEVSYAIAAEIDKQLQMLSFEKRVVNLRIDKDVCFSKSKYALVGISQSSATDVRLAVTREKQP